METSTEATEHFPARRFAKKDGKSQQQKGEQQGFLLTEKRWTSVNAWVSKHSTASSLSPNPNRKFVTNLENAHVQLQEVAHH